MCRCREVSDLGAGRLEAVPPGREVAELVAADGLAVERGRDVGGAIGALEPVAVAAGPVIAARPVLPAADRTDAGPGCGDDDVARGTGVAVVLVAGPLLEGDG